MITSLFLLELDRRAVADAERMAELDALCGVQPSEPEPVEIPDEDHCERCGTPIDQRGHRGPRKQFCERCAYEKQLERVRRANARWRAARKLRTLVHRRIA